MKNFKNTIPFYCGMLAAICFPFIFLWQGAARDGYDALRFPISSLSIGPEGWIQKSNFICTGLLLLAFAFGIKRNLYLLKIPTAIPVLVAMIATGLIAAGIFSTDPVFGYPANEPYIIDQFSIHGYLHEIFSIPVFICLPVCCFIFYMNFKLAHKTLAIYSVLSGTLMLVFFIASSFAFRQMNDIGNYAGLMQRISVISGWQWLFTIALTLHREILKGPNGKH